MNKDIRCIPSDPCDLIERTRSCSVGHEVLRRWAFQEFKESEFDLLPSTFIVSSRPAVAARKVHGWSLAEALRIRSLLSFFLQRLLEDPPEVWPTGLVDTLCAVNLEWSSLIETGLAAYNQQQEAQQHPQKTPQQQKELRHGE